MKNYLCIILLTSFPVFSQQFNLEEIMKGERFTGFSPNQGAWTIDNQQVIFDWNPNMEWGNSEYSYSLSTKKNTKLLPDAKHAPTFKYTAYRFVNYFYNDEGSLAFYDGKTKQTKVLFQTVEPIWAVFQTSENEAVFYWNSNLYKVNSSNGSVIQTTQFIAGSKPKAKEKNYLEEQQLALFQYIKDNQERSEWNKKHSFQRNSANSIYYSPDLQMNEINVSASGKFYSYILQTKDEEPATHFEQFITADGITKWSEARSKVSDNDLNMSLFIYDVNSDTSFVIDFSKLPGIRKKPNYLGSVQLTEDKKLAISNPIMHPFESKALLDIRSCDNKDRWILSLDLTTGNWELIDHQHDEAWIGGPGIGEWDVNSGSLTWIDSKNCFFQSEESGFSHVYTYNLATKQKKQLTSGNFEIHETLLSKDLKNIYVIANKIHPGVRNGYKLEISTGKLTPIFEGNFAIEWELSPDEKNWLLRKSTSTQPWELYLAANKTGSLVTKITTSTTKAFDELQLKTPEIISFTASDNVNVYARIYKPEKPNGAAVLFVHGAGYLQNAHHWWSHYHREMYFHQLLREKGYTVLDVDYRASEGYGQKHRTAIYRHMGERDLLDFIDAKDFLVKNYGVDAKRVGIYGGSYGGFITLMGMCKTPDAFACGAALRSVTDWNHYNHEYTSNILNYPGLDPEAYKRSSPIYFADGLKNPLLMLHGMVDDNVQFQDIIRMNQRFIELKKKNFELAVFPTEAHGFTNAFAWHDEYRRILELFETNLQK